MKVEELSEAQLDYWAGITEGKNVYLDCSGEEVCCFVKDSSPWFGESPYRPSSDWSQGGPIIEREEIQLVPRANGEQWSAGIDAFVKGGDTALIAAMRAYVSSKYGEDVPDAE